MQRLVALHRALNVGGRRVKMDRLAAVHEATGSTDVKTLLASGNVVFSTSVRDRDTLIRRLEASFERETGFSSEVIVRDASELRSAISRNPFLGEGYDPRLTHTVFFREAPTVEAVGAFLSRHRGPEELSVDLAEAFVYYREGMARSTLDLTPLGGIRTSRNANTVAKLLALLET